jgi:hypothetical protein
MPSFWTLCIGWSSTSILLITTSQVTRIIGVSHHPGFMLHLLGKNHMVLGTCQSYLVQNKLFSYSRVIPLCWYPQSEKILFKQGQIETLMSGVDPLLMSFHHLKCHPLHLLSLWNLETEAWLIFETCPFSFPKVKFSRPWEPDFNKHVPGVSPWLAQLRCTVNKNYKVTAVNKNVPSKPDAGVSHL